MFEIIIKILLISLATASISYTITKSKIFLSIRKFAAHYLFTCPYCMSHYISLFFACFLTATNVTVYNNKIFDIIIFTFSIITLSSFWIGYIYRTFEFMTNED